MKTPTDPERVRLDLNNLTLQQQLFDLEKADQRAVLSSLRLGKGFRAVAYRYENWLRLLSLHPDHDSAYR